ncbi:L-threonylcarbamoyladenylate synthase [Oceanithermus sp.]
MNPELRKIVEILERGGLVAWPTDTTWGLLAAARPEALARVYELKGRPRGKPLQLLVADVATARRLTDTGGFEPAWERLAARFWPGGLTLVAPAAAAAPPTVVHAGKVGLRVPADEELRQVIAASGGWLAATSLNRSGRPPAASYEEALQFAAEIDYVRPGRSAGPASSVYELPEGRLLRAGAVSQTEIEAALEEAWSRN